MTPPKYIGQNAIINKIVGYLEWDLQCSLDQNLIAKESEEDKNRRKVINYFENSQGECNGLSVLWAYGRKLEESVITSNKTADGIDGISFFNDTIELLLARELGSLSPNEKKDIDHLISNIVFYQQEMDGIKLGGKQESLTHRFEDSKKDRKLDNTFNETIVLGQEQLLDRLNKIVKPQTMIFVSADMQDYENNSGHIVSIYQNANGQISLYDSNVGEYTFGTIAELAEQLWISTAFIGRSTQMFMVQRHCRELQMQVFNFSDEKNKAVHMYPTREQFSLSKDEFLTILNNNIKVFNNYAENNSVFRNLFLKLGNKVVVELLNDENVDKELKDLMLRVIAKDPSKSREITQECETQGNNAVSIQMQNAILLSDIKSDSKDVLMKHFNSFVKDSTSTDLGKKEAASRLIPILTDRIIQLDDKFSLDEIKLIILQNLGRYKIADALLNNYSRRNRGIDGESIRKLGEIVADSITAGDLGISTAKHILAIIKDRIGVIISLETLIKFKDPDILKFMLEKYPNYYNDKDQLIKALRKENSEKTLAPILADQLMSFKDQLSIREIASILTANVGNTDLVAKFLSDYVVENKEKYISFLSGVIDENIFYGHFDTAIEILKIMREHDVNLAGFVNGAGIFDDETPQMVSFKGCDALKTLLNEPAIDNRKVINSTIKNFKDLAAKKTSPAQLLLFLANKIVPFKNDLSSSEIKLILLKNLGQRALAEKLLTANHGKDMSKTDLAEIIDANLKKDVFGHETAKHILTIIIDNHKKNYSLEELIKFKDPDILKFMLERYQNNYDKDQLMNCFILLMNSKSQYRAQLIPTLTDYLVPFKDQLSFDEIMKVLYQNPGRTEIASQLLANCTIPEQEEEKEEYKKQLRNIVKLNNSEGHSATAQEILNIMEKKLGPPGILGRHNLG